MVFSRLQGSKVKLSEKPYRAGLLETYKFGTPVCQWPFFIDGQIEFM